jgi:hypothetical protein
MIVILFFETMMVEGENGNMLRRLFSCKMGIFVWTLARYLCLGEEIGICPN